MAFRNRTHTNRWIEKSSYDANWARRSKLLLDLFISSELEDGKSYGISEYGCGTHAPFHTICKDDDRFSTEKFDIESWDEETKLLDLNHCDDGFGEADIGTFSGVLEYLNDVPEVLSRAIKAHRYLLISYAFFPISAKSNDKKYIECVRSRSVNNGWRNHYSNEEITKICSKIGVISSAGIWDRSQSLFLVRQFEGAL